MVGLLSGPPVDSDTLRRQGTELLPTTAGEVAAATFGAGAERAGETWAGWGGFGLAPDEAAQPTRTLDPQEANRLYGIPGHLGWQQPVAEDVARDLHDSKRAELLRADVIARGPGGLLAGPVGRGAVSLAAGLLDPLNVAAGLFPVVGQARYAGWLAAAGGTAERAAIRAGVGALEGSIGMAVLQPFEATRAAYRQDEYGMADALLNVAFGTAFGGGLHVLGGGVGDALRASNPVTARMEMTGPETREAVLRAAVAAIAEDTPVEVAPLLDLAGMQSAFAARLAARGETAAGSYAAYTPQGLRVELQPEVVELASLIASHDDAGAVNPAFPHAEGMQPRDRSNAASQAQIVELASRLEPERLGPSPEASTGAPIVNGAHVVESGNGRVLALRRVYRDPVLRDQAAAYRAYLVARGHAEAAGMAEPVLIGRRVTELSPEEAVAFVRGANERATLGMSTAEQARADAARAAAAIDAWRPGSLSGRDNASFVAAFMRGMPAEERGGMILSDGRLSVEGERRIRAALLGHAYGDALGPTLERLLNGEVEHMRGVAGALADVAGAWGQLRAAAARGEIPRGLDITDALGEAVQLLDRARRSGRTVAELLAQGDMMSAPSPAAIGLLRLMFGDELMRRPAAREKLAELLARYVDQAMRAEPGPGLFGMAETTASDILRAIAGDDARLQAAAEALLQRVAPGGEATPLETAGSTMVRAAAERADEGSARAEAPAAPPRLSAATGEVSAPASVPAPAAERAADQVMLAPLDQRFTADGPEGLLRLADGSTELGRVPDGLAGAPAGPIRVARGWHDEATGNGAGIAHIEARHGDELRAAGYEDAAHFIASVARNFTQVRLQSDGQLFLVLQLPGRTKRRDPAHVLIAASRQDDGDYWIVVTAGRFKNVYMEKRTLLWQAVHPAATQPSGPAGPSKSPPKDVSGSAGPPSARGQSIAEKVDDGRPGFNDQAVAVPAADDPHIATLPPAQQQVLRALYAAAATAKPAFDKVLSAVADAVGGTPMLAPLKGTARATAKIVADYGGDATQIKDLLRATIEVDTPAQARSALALVEQQMDVRPTGRRDLIGGEPGPDGYRDIKVNVNMPGGVVAEVQVNLRPMLEAKAQAHGFYEQRSAIERQSAARQRTAEEDAEIARLDARMREIYDAAWERALRAAETSRQNASSEIGAPLRRAEPGSNSRGGSVSQAAEDISAPGTLPSDTGTPSTSKNSGIQAPPEQPTIGLTDHEGNYVPRTAVEQAAQRAADQVEAVVQAELAVGRLTEADLAPLREAKAAAALAEAEARAHEAAAVCMITKGTP